MFRKMISKGPLFLVIYMFFSLIFSTFNLFQNTGGLNLIYFSLNLAGLAASSLLLFIIHKENKDKKIS